MDGPAIAPLQPEVMRRTGMALLVLVSIPLELVSSAAKPETWSAWSKYLAAAEARLPHQSDSLFLWADQAPERCERLQKGEVEAASINGGPPQNVPRGLIHDWIGAVFIPGVTVSDVLHVVRDYDRYGEYYGPTVKQAKLISDRGNAQHFSIRYFRKVLWVTVVLDIDYDIQYYRLDERRWYSTARSTCVQETRNYGQPNQHALPCNDSSGFIWGAYGISKFEARDNGVYLEDERIVLSREIPVSLRWLIEPAVNHLSKELVVSSLRRTRTASIRAAVQQTDGSSPFRLGCIPGARETWRTH